jgi:P pilus assembly chaperone PapD
MSAQNSKPVVNPNRMSSINRYLFTIVLAVTSFASLPVQAASLMIAPTRIVMEGRDRAASVQLVNRGTKTTVFRISFERKRMTETGGFEAVTDAKPGELFADQMLRYSPRQITLPPGQSQTVRLLLRKPPGLAAGEYRSHLLFREVPAAAGESIESQVTGKKKLGVNIVPIIGLSIPVIVRHGQTSATVGISNFRINYQTKARTSAQLEFDVSRSGNRSVYGDFSITHRSPGSSEKLVVANLKGVAIYTPNTIRKFRVNLTSPSGKPLDKGVLEVSYRSPPKEGEKIIASAAFTPSK